MKKLFVSILRALGFTRRAKSKKVKNFGRLVKPNGKKGVIVLSKRGRELSFRIVGWFTGGPDDQGMHYYAQRRGHPNGSVIPVRIMAS